MSKPTKKVVMSAKFLELAKHDGVLFVETVAGVKFNAQQRAMFQFMEKNRRQERLSVLAYALNHNKEEVQRAFDSLREWMVLHGEHGESPD